MIKNLSIIALFTINLVFGWTIYQSQLVRETPIKMTDDQPAITPKTILPTSHPETNIPAPVAEPDVGIIEGDYSATIAALRAAGYDEATLRQIMLATINRDHLLAQANQIDNPYWLPVPSDAVNTLTTQLNWEEDRRDQLIGLFGPEIIDDPLFIEIFKPLNATLAFLSSDKQLKLERLQRQDEAMTQRLFQGGFTQENRNDLVAQREQLQREISDLLGVDDDLEYQLRESRLADRMRRGLGDFDYSEDEFRDIFAIRARNEGSQLNSRYTDRAAYRDQRQQSETEIQDYLGDNRYQQYARSQDPAYQSLQSIGERYGNSTAEINEIYSVTQELQNQIDSVRNENGLNREQRRERLDEIRSDAMQQIETIAGKDTADSVRDNSRQLGFRRRFGPSG